MQSGGVYTALITPFRDGEVDHDRLTEQVRRQADAGVAGVVPVGTTGESPTLTHDEHRAVITTTVKAADGRIKVIAGTGSNATAEAVQLTTFAKDAGVDAALIVNPYYNKPTQVGLYRHFMTIADAVALPIMLYNIPSRCGIELTPATVARLAAHDHIEAIKEATGRLDVASEIAAECGPDFAIFSGDDSLTLPLMAVGARGVVSVLSNLVPERLIPMVQAISNNDLPGARRLHLELFELCRGLLTMATNPIPIKAAMALAGHDTGELRLPMTPLPSADRDALRKLLLDLEVELA